MFTELNRKSNKRTRRSSLCKNFLPFRLIRKCFQLLLQKLQQETDLRSTNKYKFYRQDGLDIRGHFKKDREGLIPKIFKVCATPPLK